MGVDGASDQGEVVGDGPRVKFDAVEAGPFPPRLEAAANALARAVSDMEAAGCCPVLDDGLAAGNGAMRTDGELLVTRSGRLPGECSASDVVHLEHFDSNAWSATYRPRNASHRPTSDSPLYWLALMEAPQLFEWTATPTVALHGHVLETERAARALQVPISLERTEFSTPPDREALRALMGAAPFPEHTVWIRRGHGFFILERGVDAALRRMADVAARARLVGLLP